MKELYQEPPTPDHPGEGHREGIQPGRTLDGTPVATIATIDRYYDRRRWGFDAGLWEHSLCVDLATDKIVVVSYHAASHQEKITTVIAAVDWKSQIPRDTDTQAA